MNLLPFSVFWLMRLYFLGSTLLAHAGDGNFHAIILFDPKNKEEVEEALELSAGMVHTSLSMEGLSTIPFPSAKFESIVKCQGFGLGAANARGLHLRFVSSFKKKEIFISFRIRFKDCSLNLRCADISRVFLTR